MSEYFIRVQPDDRLAAKMLLTVGRVPHVGPYNLKTLQRFSILDHLPANPLLEKVHATLAETWKRGSVSLYTMSNVAYLNTVIVFEEDAHINVVHPAYDASAWKDLVPFLVNLVLGHEDGVVKVGWLLKINKVLGSALTQADRDQLGCIAPKFARLLTGLRDEPVPFA